MNSQVRVFVADDHPIFRQGLIHSISDRNGYLIAGESSNGADALSKIRSMNPEIALLDIEMPEQSGLDVARALYEEESPTRCILLTMHKDTYLFKAAMEYDVRGYLLKDSATMELHQCLSAVLNGDFYVSPAMGHLLLERKQNEDRLHRDIPALYRLTLSERAVLRHLAENRTSREIADILCISIRTVENHRSHICRKLGINGHHKLLQFALEHKNAL